MEPDHRELLSRYVASALVPVLLERGTAAAFMSGVHLLELRTHGMTVLLVTSARLRPDDTECRTVLSVWDDRAGAVFSAAWLPHETLRLREGAWLSKLPEISGDRPRPGAGIDDAVLKLP